MNLDLEVRMRVGHITLVVVYYKVNLFVDNITLINCVGSSLVLDF